MQGPFQFGGKELRVGRIKREEKKSAKQGDEVGAELGQGAGNLQAGTVLVGNEDEVTSVEHFGSKAFHKGVGLEVEVSQHLIRSPSADEADDVGVDVSTKERHSAGGAKRASGDVIREETEGGRSEEADSSAKSDADIGWGDDLKDVVLVVGS